MAYKEPAMLSPQDAPRANADLDRKARVTRQESAVALKIAGATYTEIAKALDYANATQARTAVESALARTVGTESREQLREVEARRLDRLLRSLWTKATNEAHPEHLAAVRTAIAVIDRHARLYGLDAPTEMVVYNPSTQEIEEFVAAAAASMSQHLPSEADIIDGEIL